MSKSDSTRYDDYERYSNSQWEQWILRVGECRVTACKSGISTLGCAKSLHH